MVLRDGVLILEPEARNPAGFGGTDTQFYPVSWRGRRYLVSAHDIERFCADVNRGWEPRDDCHGSYYLRDGDWNVAVDGLPVVPERFQHLLLAEPVEAKVVETIGERQARIDVGRAAGLSPGQLLLVQWWSRRKDDPHYLEAMRDYEARTHRVSGCYTVRVVSVEDKRAVIESEEDARLRPGLRVLSRRPR